MRIAIIGNQAFSLVNFRGPLIKALSERGAQIFALAPDYDDASRKVVTSLGAQPVDYSLERAGMHPLSDSIDFIRLIRLLRSLCPDVTFAYFIKPVIYGTVAAYLAGVPHRYALVAGLGYVFNENESGSRVRNRLLQSVVLQFYKAAFCFAKRVFFQNEDDVRFFETRGVLQRKKVVRLPGTGVDLAYFRYSPPVTEPVTFLLAARLIGQKGIREYAEAARCTKEQFPQTRFLLAGGLDPNPDGLSELEVSAWVNEGVLDWLGHVTDIRPWLEKCSVYVLPSYYREGVPRSNQEAMAMGRPVITTDWIGCRETVVDGRTGFLIPIRDVESLAAAMKRFIRDPSMIERMGVESRRLVEERFDVNKINAMVLETMGL